MDLLTTQTFTATNIYSTTTGATVATYTNSSGAPLRVRVRMSLASLANSAATISFALYTASLGTTSVGRYFARYGHRLLVVWEHELKNLNTLKNKIVEFNSK